MFLKFIEAVTAGSNYNWGKFAVGWHTLDEKAYESHVDEGRSLLRAIGSSPDMDLWVLDLQTGEGVRLTPHPKASAYADLSKHKVWVCPLFEPFIEWLYRQDLSDVESLPSYVELEAPVANAGYRRPGPAR